jgi:lipoprotein signal peptidase
VASCDGCEPSTIEGAGWRGVGKVNAVNRNQKEIEMTVAETERSQIRFARLAGFMYLFLIAVYLLGVMIASRFEVPGNIAETAHRVVENELLFRFGLALGSLNALCAVILAVSLYVAVRMIDKNLALLALAFELVYAAVGAVSNLIDYAFLKQQLDAYSSGILDGKQLSALANLHSFLDAAALNIACILYGAGSILFFYLFLKAKTIPRILAAWGLFGSVLVPFTGFASIIFPHPSKLLQLGWLPIFVAEITVGLWLLFKGVNLRLQRDETLS